MEGATATVLIMVFYRNFLIFTARKRSLGQGNIFAPVCHSVHREGYPSMPCRWYPSMPCRSLGGWVSQHALQVPRPHPRGSLRGLARGGLQAHTWGGLQANTRGGLQAHARGGGEVSRLTPREEGVGVSQHALRQTPLPRLTATAVGGYASYWNAFLFLYRFVSLFINQK